jgi:hypothetical protein
MITPPETEKGRGRVEPGRQGNLGIGIPALQKDLFIRRNDSSKTDHRSLL